MSIIMRKEQRWIESLIYSVDELDTEDRRLYEAAFEAAGRAYAVYSGFQVGAALLLANGEVVLGNNQENVAYPSGLCAERTALFYAGACYPDVAVRALAIAAVKEGVRQAGISPCGACRQVMAETERRSGIPLRILLCGRESITVFTGINSLLPYCFDSF